MRLQILIDGDSIASNKGSNMVDILELMKNFLNDPESQLESVHYFFTHFDSTSKKLLSVLNKLKKAEHIRSKPLLACVLDHMMGRLKAHDDALILRPDKDDRGMVLALLRDLEPICEPSQINTPLSQASLRDLSSACSAAESRITQQLFQDEDLSATGAMVEDLDALKILSGALSLPVVQKNYEMSCAAVNGFILKIHEQAKAALDAGSLRGLRFKLDKQACLERFEEHVDMPPHKTAHKELLARLNAHVEHLCDLHGLDFLEINTRLEQLKDVQYHLIDTSAAGTVSSSFLLPKHYSCYSEAVSFAVDKVVRENTRAHFLINNLQLAGDLANLMHGLQAMPESLENHLLGRTPPLVYEELKKLLDEKLQSSFARGHGIIVESLTDQNEPDLRKNYEILRDATAHLVEHISDNAANYCESCCNMLLQLQDSCFAAIDLCIGSQQYAKSIPHFQLLHIVERVTKADTSERHLQKIQHVEHSIAAVSADIAGHVAAFENGADFRPEEYEALGTSLRVLHEATAAMGGVVSPECDLHSDYEAICRQVVDITAMLAKRLNSSMTTDMSSVTNTIVQLQLCATHIEDVGCSSAVLTNCRDALQAFTLFVYDLCEKCKAHTPVHCPEATTDEAIAGLKSTILLLHSYRDSLCERSVELSSLHALIYTPDDEYDTADEDEPHTSPDARSSPSRWDRHFPRNGSGGSAIAALQQRVDEACSKSSSLLQSSCTMIEGGGMSCIQDGTSCDLACHHFDKLTRLLDMLTRLMQLDGLAAGCFERTRDALQSQLVAWVKDADGRFRKDMKSDDLEAAQHTMHTIEELLALRSWVETVDAVHERMRDDIADKTDAFTGRVHNLLNKQEFSELAQVMNGQAALAGPQQELDYTAAQEKITKWIKLKYEQAIQILESLDARRKLSAKDQLRDLAESMRFVELAQPLAEVIGVHYSDWTNVVSSKCKAYVNRIAQKALNCVQRWNFVQADELLNELELFMVCPKYIQDIVRQLIQTLNEGVHGKVESLSTDMAVFIDERDCAKIDRMLDGLKNADREDLDWPPGMSDKFGECHSQLRNQLEDQCSTIQASLDDWDCDAADKQLKTLGDFFKGLNSSNSQSALPRDEKVMLEQHQGDLQSEIISERGLKEDATKVQLGLQGLHSVNARAFKSNMHCFLDAQIEKVRQIKHSLANHSGGCVSNCESELQLLQRYASVIGTMYGSMEVAEMLQGLVETLVDQVEEFSSQTRAARKQSNWDVVEKCDEFLRQACPVVMQALTLNCNEPCESEFAGAMAAVISSAERSKKERMHGWSANKLSEQYRAHFEMDADEAWWSQYDFDDAPSALQSIPTVLTFRGRPGKGTVYKPTPRADSTVMLKQSLIERAEKVAAVANEVVQNHEHAVGTMTTQFEEVIQCDFDGLKESGFDPKALSEKLNALKKNESALGTRLGVDVDVGVSYPNALRHVRDLVNDVVECSTDNLRGEVCDFQLLSECLVVVHKLSSVHDEEVAKRAGEGLEAMITSTHEHMEALFKRIDAVYEQAMESNDHEQFNRMLEHLIAAEKQIFTLPKALRRRLLTDDTLPWVDRAIVRTVQDSTTQKKKELLQQLKSRVDVDCAAIAHGLLDMYSLPSNCSHAGVKQHCHAAISKVLDACYTRSKASKSLDFSELGRQLVDAGSRGGEIVEEFPQFGAYRNEKFMAQTAKVTPEYALEQMAKLNKMGAQDKKTLWEAYVSFSYEYEAVLRRSAFLKTGAKLAKKVALDAKRYARSEDYPRLVATIFAVWSLGGSDGSSETVPMRPHPVQVMGIFKLLGMDTAVHSLAKIMKSLIAGGAKALSSQLLQVKTGEGKSVLLGVLATFLAVLGCDVDVVCYSKYLSTRDKSSFAAVFAALGVAEAVSYNTFNDLAEKAINARGNVRDMARTCVSGLDIVTPPRAKKRTKVLLIDEVDVFFSEDFYGKTFNPVTRFRTPQTDEIQRFIWDNRTRLSLPGTSLPDLVKALPAYAVLIAQYPQLQQLIDADTSQMVADMQLVRRGKMKKYVVVGGTIGYKSHDSVSTTASYSYQTMFAHMKENTAETPMDVEGALGIKLACGRFSFAEMAKTPSPYTLILGVTGTLDCLTDFQQSIIKDDYLVKSRGMAPSIYGESRLSFRKEEDIYIESDYDLYARKVQEEIMNCTKKGGAVIVFFDTEEDVVKFTDSPYSGGIPNLHTVTTKTDNIDHFVKQATRSGHATLFSRVHGRGLDFTCHDPAVEKQGGVRVLQAFLSVQKSEEVQIMGRTARQDQQGSFALVLLESDLVKHGISAAEIAEHKQSNGMYTFLDAKRTERSNEQCGELRARVEDAKGQHKESMAFASNLRANERAAVLTQLNAWACA